MEHAVVVDNVTKKYGAVEALKGVSLTVPSGELFGIIGPDGAGKTSLFRILTTLLLPDSGNASVCGLDIAKDYKEIRRRVGYMPGPAARPIWATRQMDSSTSLAATSIRSASSSMTTTTVGIFFSSWLRPARALNPARSFTPFSENSL